MPQEGFWKRVRSSRLFEVLAVYLGASWIALEVSATLQEALELPRWITLAVIILLGGGLVLTIVGTWIHSRAIASRADRPAAAEDGESAEEDREPFPWRRALLAVVVTVSLLFGFAGAYVLFRDRVGQAAGSEGDGPAPGVAVLPFTVRGPEMEIWREGLVDLLSVNLDGATLRAIDSRTVFARWEETVGADREADLETLLEVARATGAQHAIIGTAVSSGLEVRLAADIRSLDDDELVSQARIDGPPDSMIPLVDQLSIQLLRALVQGSARAVRIDLAARTTRSVEGLKAFLEGERLYRRGDYEAAERAYSHAVEADSGFALASYRLGLTRGWTGAAGTELAVGPLERANLLASGLPEREAALVRLALAVNRSEAELIDSARVLANRYPDDAEAAYLLGELYYHQGHLRRVGFEDTERAFVRAQELDPGHAPHYLHLVDLAFRYHADSVLAAERMARYRELAPESLWNREYDITFRLAFGSDDARQAAFAELDAADPWYIGVVADRLRHPRFWPQREQVHRIQRRRGTEEQQRNAAIELFWSSLFQRGWLDRALVYLDDPLAAAVIGPCELVAAEMEIRAMPRALLEAELSRAAIESRIESGSPPPGELGESLACGALYAAIRGREADFAYLRDRFAGLVDLAAADGDSSGVEQITDVTRIVDGLGAWLSGDPAAAYRILVDFPAFFDLAGPDANRWWGRILLDVSRPREALPYFNANRGEPLALLYSGTAYEAMGRDAEARAAYQYFLQWWAEADPALQPLVNEVRQRLERIAGRLN